MTQLYQSTGLGIKSTQSRHWLPQPSKSAIMSKSRFQRFMGKAPIAQAMQPASLSGIPQPSTSAWATAGYTVTKAP